MQEESLDRVLLPLFDGSNFAAWKFRMQVLLEERELSDCVLNNVADVQELKEEQADTEAVKTQKKKAREDRMKKDRRCKSLLISRIQDSQLEYIQEKKSPKDIWDALHRVFERRSIASRMHLKRQMLSMRFEGGTLQQHFLKFDRLVREYRATGAQLDDLDVVCHLLLTLGSSYAGVVTALETMPEENLSIEFVKCRLLDEETKRKGVELSPASTSDAAFFGGKKKKTLKCFGCHKEGHKLVDCPEKKKKQSGQKGPKGSSSKANVAESSERGGVCFVGVSDGIELKESNRTRWFIDSGATDHLVRDRNLFSELRRLEKPIEIAVAKDGETIVAEHSGTIQVVSVVNGKSIDCTIKDALYVPSLRCNLFSVLKVEQAGMRVVFECGKAKIYRGSEIVASGSLRDKLYELDFYSVKNSAGNSSLVTCGRIQKNNELWHRRFGHLNEKSLKCLMRNEMVSGLSVNADGDKNVISCESCLVGKQTRKPFSSREGKRTSRVLELVHTDVCGPVTPEGLFGKRYFVTFTDDWSHFAMVYLISSKDEVMQCFEEYEALVTAKFGRKISRVRCDNGGEYTSKRFKKFCKARGIQVEWTVPYTPEQNGVSERLNRTLVEKARAMLADSGIDKQFWGQAVETAAYLTNRSPTAAIESNQTPYELWESRKPNVSNIRVFGSRVFVHIPQELRRKLDAKAWNGIFVGYSHNGYRVWDPVKKKIVTARDVDFIETSCEVKKTANQFVEMSANSDEDQPDEDQSDEDQPDEDQSDEDQPDEDQSDEEDSEPDGNEEVSKTNEAEKRRSKRKKAAPVWHQDFNMEYAGFALSALNFVEDIPSSIDELKKRDDWEMWKAAIDDEMSSLKRNNTWSLVKLPEGRSAVTCKWVFKVKRGVSGKPDKYKARLVARGFSQKQGFDYTETYSPVAKLDTMRAVLALANRERLLVHQMDVKTAFLNGELTDEVYMTQPDGFKQGNGLVCRLNRSIYGLKQASRTWNERFHGFVEKLGFVRSRNDQCLYTRGVGQQMVILVLYVDDILLIGSSLKILEAVKRRLAAEFEMTDDGEIRQFLGMCVDRDIEAGVLKISQRGYFEGLLERFGMTDCKPISTPIENRLRLKKGEERQRTSKPYRELVGCLMYASLTTRPDLSAATNYFSQFQSCPTDEHWVHLKRMLRYIKGTLDVGLVYKLDEDAPLLEIYSDADWANDLVDRRSVTGGVFKMYGCTVGWVTRKQQTVALSSTEAELSALCTTACHAMWMIRLLHDLGRSSEGPIPFYEDNQSTIRIAEDERDSKRLKHVDTKFHFLRDLVQQGLIDIKFVRSSEQQADVMTKGLPAATFKGLRSKIGLEACCG